MGGVDLCDNLVTNYRIRVRGKKLLWPIFTNYIDVTMTKAWKLSKVCSKENKKSLLDFRCKVALSLLKTPFECGEFYKNIQATVYSCPVKSAFKANYMVKYIVILS